MKNFKKISGVLSLALVLGNFTALGAVDEAVSSEKPKIIMNNSSESQEFLSDSALNSSLEAKIKEIILKNKDLKVIPEEDLMKENLELKKRINELESEQVKLNGKITDLSAENINLKTSSATYKKRMQRYKRKLEEKKDCVTAEAMQAEIDKVRTQMILDFTGYLSEYIKQNPSKKIKNIDLRGLFSRFINFNVNYTANGDTTVAPLAVKGVAKGTLAGGAAMTS